MGVLSGVNTQIEKAWSSYDIPDMDGFQFDQGCVRANARMVAFIVKVDQGYILRVTTYAPNSGGTSPEGSKSSCTRMAQKLMYYQKMAVFIQMVQTLYPGVMVLFDGDQNTIHEGHGQVHLRTMKKGQKYPRISEFTVFDLGMSGCTKTERLGMAVMKKAVGLSSSFDTALVPDRVVSDNRTAGLSNFVLTEQVKHSMRLPVGDTITNIVGGEHHVRNVDVTEAVCLKDKDLVTVQLCLDMVLHTSNIDVHIYDISPPAHQSESMSRGSDHRDTSVLCLNVTSSLWSTLDLSAELGTHVLPQGPEYSTGMPYDSGVPFPSVVTKTNRKGTLLLSLIHI